MRWVVLWFIGIAATAVGLTTPAAAAAVPTVRALLLVGGTAHDYEDAPAIMAKNIRMMLQDEVILEFVISKDLDEVKPGNIGNFGLIMLNLCRQTELSTDQKKGLLEAVRRGTPLLALHCMLWSFASWPEFRQMLGAYVVGHAKRDEMCVDVVNPGNALTVGLPSRFELYDEPYIVDERDPSIHVVVRTCQIYKKGERIMVRDENGREAAFVRSGDSGPDRNGPEPQVWTTTFGKGRVLVVTLGHDLRTQEDGNYLRLLHNGISWLLSP